jgi:hypothetical protein
MKHMPREKVDDSRNYRCLGSLSRYLETFAVHEDHLSRFPEAWPKSRFTCIPPLCREESSCRRRRQKVGRLISSLGYTPVDDPIHIISQACVSPPILPPAICHIVKANTGR